VSERAAIVTNDNDVKELEDEEEREMEMRPRLDGIERRILLHF
jgi:hypothetical protein